MQPYIREKFGYSQPLADEQPRIDPSKIKTPLRITISAFLVSSSAFCGCYYVLDYIIRLEGDELFEILLKIFMSGLRGFGIFMTIVSADHSRRMQKMRTGEKIDDED
jgi:hypothetical protein